MSDCRVYLSKPHQTLGSFLGIRETWLRMPDLSGQRAWGCRAVTNWLINPELLITTVSPKAALTMPWVSSQLFVTFQGLLEGPGTLPSCARSCGPLKTSRFCACFPGDITKLAFRSPLYASQPGRGRKKPSHFLAWVTEGRKVKEKQKNCWVTLKNCI